MRKYQWNNLHNISCELFGASVTVLTSGAQGACSERGKANERDATCAGAHLSKTCPARSKSKTNAPGEAISRESDV